MYYCVRVRDGARLTMGDDGTTAAAFIDRVVSGCRFLTDGTTLYWPNDVSAAVDGTVQVGVLVVPWVSLAILLGAIPSSVVYLSHRADACDGVVALVVSDHPEGTLTPVATLRQLVADRPDASTSPPGVQSGVSVDLC